MHGRIFLSLIVATTLCLWGVDNASAQSEFGSGIGQSPPANTSLQSGRNTDYERHNQAIQNFNESINAINAGKLNTLAPIPDTMPQMPIGRPATVPYSPSILAPAAFVNPLYPPGIGFNPNVNYAVPNFAQSPNIRKFVDKLPGLGVQGCTLGTGVAPNVVGGTCNQNNLGQFIPIAMPDTATFTGGATYPASDYYQIGVAQYSRKMHSDLPATTLRGYYIMNDAATDPALGGTPQYLGPAILSRAYHPDKATAPGNTALGVLPIANGKPTRLKVTNHLPLSNTPQASLFLPVDGTLMGAGPGPKDLTGAACDYGTQICADYPQNRIAVHLHGGRTPWISDGTPYQWFTPANDPSPYHKGDSFQNVPDMVNNSGTPCAVGASGSATCFAPAVNDGTGTLYYSNEQSARLMFYHDHAVGITRLNVLAGLAAPYLLVDQIEDDLIDGTNASGVFGTAAPAKILPDNGGGVYRYGIPLVFQDKAFVNDVTTPPGAGFPANYLPTPKTLTNDPNWYAVTTFPSGVYPGGGSLWVGHEYMPIENIFDPTGNTPFGRWDYAPFLIPPAVPKNLTLPTPSIIPEAFGDTAVVNGTAFPYITLNSDPYRFRMLSAGNDRSLNLQLYSASVPTATVTFTGGGCTTLPIASTQVKSTGPNTGVITGITLLSPGVCTSAPTVTITDVAGHVPTTVATATATFLNGALTGAFTITNPGAGYLAGTICKGLGATVPPAGFTWQGLCTEVAMVPAAPNSAYPTWPIDGRDGGVPDPTTQGPVWIQIGNEAGLLARTALWPQQPIDYDYNRQNIPPQGVSSRALLLMGAMRADVIVDFSSYAANDFIIVYNDAPAPMPGFWTLNDYYTNDPDQTSVGGSVPTPPGFGPNTRTLMQIGFTGTHTSTLPSFFSSALPGFDRKSPIGAYLFPIPGPTPDGAGLTALNGMLPKAFALSQDHILVPQTLYNAAYGAGFATSDNYVQGIQETLALQVPTTVASLKAVPGGGYTVPPTIAIVGGGCTTTPTATAGLNPMGPVSLVTAGSGYTSTPTITFGPPLAGGVQATGVVELSGGIPTAITIVEPGSNYDTTATAVAPTCTISGGGGTGATCLVQLASAGLVGSITVTNPGAGCTSQPYAFFTAAPGDRGTGAAATVLLKGALVMTGKNITEGSDPDFGRVNIQLGSTPNALTPSVGAGPVIGIARYIDPPTEIVNNGEVTLWRFTHLGVDSHAVHVHLFDMQVINRVDYTNVIKPPYQDEIGWRDVIRTNPFEDIMVAFKPVAMVLPFPLPQSNRLLDPSTPVNSPTNFLPILPPLGVPAVAQVNNTVTNFGYEYVWHCHLLGHEENDMMRPIVFNILPVPTANGPAVAFNPTLGLYHVAIRRADNKIYVGTANVGGILNSDFAPLPTGTTATAPSIAWDPLHQKIIIANKGFATTNLWISSMNANGTGFSGWTMVAAGTTASPAIAWNSTTNQLQYSLLGAGNTAWVGSINYNGTTFSAPTQTALTGAVVASAPAMAIASTGTPGKIYLAARSTTLNRIIVNSITSDLLTQHGWSTFPTGTTALAVSAAWNGTTSKLELVEKGANSNNVFKAAVDAALGVFTGWTQVTGAVTTDVPAVGIDPALAPENIFTINGGNVSGYTTAAM
jgi:FtsP/CotA-like multicopper oxidase with cupredoxin domain